jgi:hypothetical protein
MDLDTLFEILNRALLAIQDRPLNPVETLLLRGIWQLQTYNQIAQEVGYSPGYLTNVVAPELLRRLSHLTGQRLTKKNCRVLLELYAGQQTAVLIANPAPTDFAQPMTPDRPSFPSGPIAVHSPFYIARPPIEEQVFEEIQKPGALIRVKAPREMGKTSLLLQVLDYAQHLGYHTVYISLEQADQEIYSSPNRFLRWLCANVAHQLQREPKLDDYWDDDIGSKVSCTIYIRNYLLTQMDAPFILILDEVNQIFEHAQVAKDFFPLLRSWYEDAKRLPISQKLRLLIAHSTEVYVPLQIHQSPFNVGLATQLTGFNLNQVQQLALRYDLNWQPNDAEKMMSMVGGHPGLCHLGIYYFSRQELTIAEFLETAPTTSGIYQYHLQRHWITLQEQPDLANAFFTVLKAKHPIQIESLPARKLISIGLVTPHGNEVCVSCELYQQYFQEMLT